MPDIAFINESFMPLAEAKVSVEDRGFQFGDGVYELLRVYGGVPFRPEEHIARLERSARALLLPFPLDMNQWKGLIVEAIQRSGYREAKVYIQLTRGVAPRDHTFSATLKPTVIITIRQFNAPPPILYKDGAAVITIPDLRWGRCDVKSICLLANVMAKQQAQQAGAFETLFIRDGQVLEGATSNIIAVRGGMLLTPPESPLLLSGVTRSLVLSLAREAGIPVEERSLVEKELYDAEELFLTGTTIEILPITRVNNRQVGAPTAGALSADLAARFRKLHA